MNELDWGSLGFNYRKTNAIVYSRFRDGQWSEPELTDDFVQADILDEEAPDTELPSQIYLFQGLPKGDRME